jgi:hypothetical protein
MHLRHQVPGRQRRAVSVGVSTKSSGSQQKELASGKCTKRWPEDAGPRMQHETRMQITVRKRVMKGLERRLDVRSAQCTLEA